MLAKVAHNAKKRSGVLESPSPLNIETSRIVQEHRDEAWKIYPEVSGGLRRIHQAARLLS